MSLATCWVFHAADRLDQTVDDELLVENGQLHGHPRQLLEVLRRLGIVVLAVPVIDVAHGVAMNAIKR